jgi:hypothetical protein
VESLTHYSLHGCLWVATDDGHWPAKREVTECRVSEACRVDAVAFERMMEETEETVISIREEGSTDESAGTTLFTFQSS